MPILNYGREVWGFWQSYTVEVLHLHFVKCYWRLTNQHRMVLCMLNWGEEINCLTKRYLMIVKYRFKLWQQKKTSKLDKFATLYYKTLN